ncbi:nonstructural protein [Pepper chlorotic spot virus]|uniref:Nonstructural protein n=1 Tax=Pepper chlorotic spot virus TaxID=1414655 RepID=A0A1P8SKH3_9VIRU|nr:nonstructural protein [Pepper chlorotic spot virus]APY22754.1 nonstructural protein [Pepper chlorotic spot virus]
MSNVFITAAEFLKTYGTKDTRSVNDCYSMFSATGQNFLNLFMHSSPSIKTSFSINELGRNEDIKLHESEFLEDHQCYKHFEKFGLDFTFCGHTMNIVVSKPDVKNTGCRFVQHNQIFLPNQSTSENVGEDLQKEKFHEITNIENYCMTPNAWVIELCLRSNFFISASGDYKIEYGYPVMGKTVSYWRENLPKEKMLSVNQKVLQGTSRLTNRVLSPSAAKAIQVAAELVKDENTILSVRQLLTEDIKSQYRICFTGALEEGSFTRTYKIRAGQQDRIICIYAKTVIDSSYESTTLIVKVVNKSIQSNYHDMLQNHSDCKAVSSSLGITDSFNGDPNYNQIIARSLIKTHTLFALELSKYLEKKVIIFMLYEKQLTKKTMPSPVRDLAYLEDSDGNVYFTSETLKMLPKSLSTITYLKGIAPSCWKESIEDQHFYVEYKQPTTSTQTASGTSS